MGDWHATCCDRRHAWTANPTEGCTRRRNAPRHFANGLHAMQLAVTQQYPHIVVLVLILWPGYMQHIGWVTCNMSAGLHATVDLWAVLLRMANDSKTFSFLYSYSQYSTDFIVHEHQRPPVFFHP